MPINDSWDEGYTSDEVYTYGYYHQLNPIQFKLNFLAHNLAFPKIKTACELGFGQGVSINMHAVSSDVQWYGNDFFPDQVTFAQNFASKSKTNIHLYDDSFEEFLKRDDLPQFDYIAIHGIWSWITDENKEHIVEFVRKKLATGGILYISYNTLPGFCKAMQLREMLSQFNVNCQAQNISSKDKVDRSLNFVEDLFKLSPDVCAHNAKIFETINDLKTQDHNYLAHEYLNQNWDPMYFHEFAKYIEKAKVSYVCGANIIDSMDLVNFSEQNKELFKTINNPILIETAKDFIENRQFRCDIWVKGKVSLSETDKKEALNDLSFILIGNLDEINKEHKGNSASVDLSKILEPMLLILKDKKVHTFSELLKATTSHKFNYNDTLLAIESLVSQNVLFVTHKVSNDVAKRAKKLNDFILSSQFMNSKIVTLACPLIGGALNFNLLTQLYFLAYKKYGAKITPDNIIEFINTKLSIKDLTLSKKGVPLDKNADKESIIRDEASKFRENLPLYRTLEMIE